MECTQHKNSLCRVCLKCDPTIRLSGASIFDKTEDVSIYERLNTICDVDIKPEDGLPDRICVECLLELHNTVRFKQKCESSNKVLLSAANTNSQSAVKEDAKDVKLEEDHYTDHEFLDEDVCELEEPYSPPDDYVKQEHEELQEDEGIQPEQQPNTKRPNRANSELTNEISTNNIKLEEGNDADHEYVDDNKDDDPHSPQDDYVKHGEQQNKGIPQPNTEKPSKAIDLKLECHDCGGIFKTKCKLKVHWKREHLKQLLTCEKCKRVFKTFKTLNDHKKKESLNCNTTYKIFTIEGTGRFRKYYCKQCDYTTSKNERAFKHTVKHTGDKRFICDLCNKSFTQRTGLHYHMECFHKMYKKEAKCTICGKFIQGLRMFNIHMRRHKNSNKTVSCEICFKTIKKVSLKCHMERHLVQKGHSCEACGKEFATRSSLCNHIKRIHERNANLMCPKCGFKHHILREINSHISKHRGDNVPCVVCGRFFKNDERLALHMERHNSKNFKCSECDKVYFIKKYFVRHLNEVHKIVSSQ